MHTYSNQCLPTSALQWVVLHFNSSAVIRAICCHARDILVRIKSEPEPLASKTRVFQ